MSETEKNEDEAVAIAREGLTHTHGTFADPEVRAVCVALVEQHAAREAARASMPEDRSLRWAHGVIETHRALGHDCHEYSFAAVAIIAAHEREVGQQRTIDSHAAMYVEERERSMAKDATIAELRDHRASVIAISSERLDAVIALRADVDELRAALLCAAGWADRQTPRDDLDAWRKLAEGGK